MTYYLWELNLFDCLALIYTISSPGCVRNRGSDCVVASSFSTPSYTTIIALPTSTLFYSSPSPSHFCSLQRHSFLCSITYKVYHSPSNDYIAIIGAMKTLSSSRYGSTSRSTTWLFFESFNLKVGRNCRQVIWMLTTAPFFLVGSSWWKTAGVTHTTCH